MIVLLSEDDGVSESQFVAVDQIAAVLGPHGVQKATPK